MHDLGIDGVDPPLAADLPGQFPTTELHDALSVDLDIVVVFPVALLRVVVLTAVTGCACS